MSSSESNSPSRLNRLRELWASGKCAFGTIATIPSIQTVQVLARSGLDFMIIDMEHGPIDAQAAHAMIVATGGTPLVPLVRVSSKELYHAKIPLDLGAMGVCFPMTSCALMRRTSSGPFDIRHQVSAIGGPSTLRSVGT